MIWVNEIKYVKVFKVDVTERYVKAQVSTSEKKQDGTYENSSWFPVFVGNCKNNAARLKKDDKITITKAKITNVYNREKKQAYFNMTVFAFEVEGESDKQSGNFPAFDEDFANDFRAIDDDFGDVPPF